MLLPHACLLWYRVVGLADAILETLFFEKAVVDNDRLDDQRFWSQRYFLNKRFWAGSGAPFFVFIGGEGEEGACRLSDRMYMYDLANQNNASSPLRPKRHPLLRAL